MAQEHRIKPNYRGEQVGPFESRLKEKLAAAFVNHGIVRTAYLAHADLGDGSDHNVVLGLVAPGCDRPNIVEQVERAFASLFHGSQHLDILFLDQGGEPDIRKVCRPFFERGRLSGTTSSGSEFCGGERSTN
jgi:hypothetical protein